MSAPGPSDDLWAWAGGVYAAPGVKPALLSLQDENGADVLLLLWAAHAAAHARALLPEAARSAYAALEDLRTQIETIRAVRRAPRAGPEAFAIAAKEALAVAELALERLALARLAAVPGAPAHAAADDLLAGNLAAALHAAGVDPQGPANAALRALCEALLKALPPAP